MTTFKTLIKSTLTPIALCLSIAITSPAMADRGQHKKHDGMRQLLSGLALTDSQKQDIRLVLKQSREDRSAARTDDKAFKSELRRFIQSPEWDQEAVESMITQNQAQLQEKALIRAINKNKVWNLLTEAQQGELVAKMETRKTKHKAKKAGRKTKDSGENLKRLNLSAEQLAAVKTIKSEGKANSAASKANLKAYKQAERALIHSADFNEQAWQTLNAQYQQDFQSMALLKLRTKNDIWNLLTTEQKTLVAKEVKSKNRKQGKRMHYHDSI